MSPPTKDIMHPSMFLPTPEQRKKLLLPIILVVVLLGIYLVYFEANLRHFRIVSIEPAMDSVSTSTPYIQLTFNRALTTNGLSITSTPSIISSSAASGAVLTLFLNTPLSLGGKYTVTIVSLHDSKGEIIANKRLSFTTKDIPDQSLPPDQQQYILQKQTYRPQSKNNVAFSGIDTLLNYGLTLTEEDVLKSEFFNYNSGIKSVVIDPASIVADPHNPDSTSDSMHFNVSVDNKAFNAKILYSNLSSVQLQLFDTQTNSVVYDSGLSSS